MLNQEYIEKKTKELMEKFDVRAVNGDQLIGALSGGNQQKLVLSREVDKDPDLILACQPVRGLDIGAIKFIHNVCWNFAIREGSIVDIGRIVRLFS